MNPLPHEARLVLTGWATPTPQGFTIGNLHIHTRRRLTELTRVNVTTYPRTKPDGRISHLDALPKSVRLAKPNQPNGGTFIVTGQLLRLSRGSGNIQVKVSPSRSETRPFIIGAQATSDLLQTLDPVTHHVRITGRLLQVGPGVLLAETAQSVHAPVPERWWRYRKPRSITGGLKISPEPFDP